MELPGKVPTSQNLAALDSARTLFEVSPCPVLLINRTGEVLYCNAAAKGFLGWSYSGNDDVTPAETPEGGAPQERSISGHHSFSGAVFVQLTRTKFWNCVELAPLPEDLNKARVLAIAFELGAFSASNLLVFITSPDVSQDANAQSSLEAREEFLSTAAHDLKNPLSAIFGYADALLETSGGASLSEQQRSILARIRATAARSVDLIRNYQQLSELSSRRLRLTDLAPDLGAACRSVVDDCFREDPNAHTVRAVLAKEALPVAVDRIPLERILTNLFANALRYTPRGGTITLTTSRNGSFARFEINNSLPIIPKEELAKIFSRRFRGSTSTGTSGTGLGLYIVKSMVTELGGSVAVKSEEGTGTTFTIELPMAHAAS